MPVVQPFAVKLTLSVPQTLPLVGVIAGAAGLSPVVMMPLFDNALVPQLLVQVAVYSPTPTLMLLVVSPVLHFNVPLAQLDVKVNLSVPHTLPPPVTTGAAGLSPAVTVMVLDKPLLPQMFSHVAVYVPTPTLILKLVELLLHSKLPTVQPVVVNVTVLVPQAMPPPLMTGATAVGTFCIVTEPDDSLSPHSLIHFTLYVPDSLT